MLRNRSKKVLRKLMKSALSNFHTDSNPRMICVSANNMFNLGGRESVYNGASLQKKMKPLSLSCHSDYFIKSSFFHTGLNSGDLKNGRFHVVRLHSIPFTHFQFYFPKIGNGKWWTYTRALSIYISHFSAPSRQGVQKTLIFTNTVNIHILHQSEKNRAIQNQRPFLSHYYFKDN